MLLENGRTLDGGLKLALVARRDAHPADREVLDAALFEALRHEARMHGCVLDAKNFKDFLAGHEAKNVTFLYTVAAWDVCADVRQLEPVVVGAAVEYRTVVVKRNGAKIEPYDAVFREDTCFHPEALRALKRKKPDGMSFPETGIAEYFERERMRHLAKDASVWGIVGECHANNRMMKNVMNRIGAKTGEGEHGSVLRLDCFRPPGPETVEIEYPLDPRTQETLPYAFLARCQHNEGEVVASFTEAISTFDKKALLARVQIASQGRVPEQAVLQDILLSLLAAGQEKMAKPAWGQMGRTPSPLIVHGAPRDIMSGLLISSGEELFNPRERAPAHLLGRHIPTMLVHIGLDEPPHLQAALENMPFIRGRKLGPNTMKVVEHSSNVPMAARRPLSVVKASDLEPSGRILGFAA
jgi:hypothetical protein